MNKMQNELELSTDFPIKNPKKTERVKIVYDYTVEIDGVIYDLEDLCCLLDELDSDHISIEHNCESAKMLLKFEVIASVGSSLFPAQKGRNFDEFQEKINKIYERIIIYEI